MIGFGELRRLSAQWHVDLGVVERAYAIDWMLKGLFDQPALGEKLVLRGPSALRYAYCPDYAAIEEPELLAPATLSQDDLCAALVPAVDAAKSGGVQYGSIECKGGSAKVGYVGPLGRRSAAQPHISLSFIAGHIRLEPARRPLLHRFGDECTATVAATAIEELAAERMSSLAVSPRVRDLYDLWFMLSRPYLEIDRQRTHVLASEIAAAKGAQIPSNGSLYRPQHRPALERGWDNALRRFSGHPPFDQVERELASLAWPAQE
jgi:predicted nucleotidyltransferase component of viral defense system